METEPPTKLVEILVMGPSDQPVTPEDYEMIERLGGTILKEYMIIDGYYGKLPLRSIPMLALSERVEGISANSKIVFPEEPLF